MIVLQILSLAFWIWVLPVVLGLIPAGLIDKERKLLGLPLICGYILQWFVFHVLAVPIILLQQTSPLFDFTFLTWIYGTILVLTGLLVILFYVKKRELLNWRRTESPFVWGRTSKIFFALFWVLFAIQILGILFLAFADGDDAYYVAVATIAEKSDTMYLIQAYTGGVGTMDLRHALAPMPMWIAFVSRVSGIHVATVAHVAVPIVLLLITYGLYASIGQILCKDKREMVPLFLFISSLLVTFGNYSMKTAETFLITRTAQGKSILGNVVFPFVILLVLMLIDRVARKDDTGVMLWCMLIMLSGVACLCSALGGVLIIALYGVVGFYTSLCYKRWNILNRMLSCCLPALLSIALYLFVQKF